MIFRKTAFMGVYLVELEPICDERGFFARSWCKEEFEKHGLHGELVQSNISYNKKAGTLRGMHYQAPPYEEIKMVRVTRGEIYDVIIDLRPESLTYMQWASFELTAEQKNMLYIPKGFAHGFQTLDEDTEVWYQMSQSFHPEAARGIHYNDPQFSIHWLLNPPPVISKKDLSYPLWKERS